MDAAALVALFRQRADDAVAPHLFATDWLLGVLSEAEKEACLRARLIWDESSAFLSVPLVADQATYALDPRIDRIARVAFFPAGVGLRPRDLELTGVGEAAFNHRQLFNGFRGGLGRIVKHEAQARDAVADGGDVFAPANQFDKFIDVLLVYFFAHDRALKQR